jgi:hypothetical protein
MSEDAERKKLVFTIFFLADALIVTNFLGFQFFNDPKRLTLNVTIISWVIFVATLIAVNIWLYHVYYKWPHNARAR